HLVRRAVHPEAAAVEPERRPAVAAEPPGIVSGHDDGPIGARELVEVALARAKKALVHVGESLVEDQERAWRLEEDRERQPLQLSCGELLQERKAQLVQTGEVEDRVDARTEERAVHA